MHSVVACHGCRASGQRPVASQIAKHCEGAMEKNEERLKPMKNTLQQNGNYFNPGNEEKVSITKEKDLGIKQLQ